MKQSKNEINLGEGSVGRLLLDLGGTICDRTASSIFFTIWWIVFISVISRKTGAWH